MYLFTRQGRIRGTEGLKWAVTIRDCASEVLGTEVGLWANTLSPAFGTLTWTSWWNDLGALRNEMMKLSTDKAYLDLAQEKLDDYLVPLGLLGGHSPNPEPDVF
jgi:hypothetical protein